MSEELKLFHVQDGDRPMWVIAKDWKHAADLWRELLSKENESDCSEEEPYGIQLVCESNELILPRKES